MRVAKLAFVCVTLLSAVAVAGDKTNFEIYLSIPASGTATAAGSIIGVQNSSDSKSVIQCQIKVDNTVLGATQRLFCHARDVNGNDGTCLLNNPPQAFVDLVYALKDNDKLTFTWDVSNQQCKSLEIQRGSWQVRSNGAT
ncbi:hypothetical protein COCOR_01911 [Corallococcus coralloides DSM 2259]|uniref:Lipoprotein n=1 Tax=Corallococcus coralloides (strain ATCC 25202 / DSM 2259 / NBRC 100086 / M2) TaxID=1144275 RepID=H8MG70_CORCM|nr:hypothetical protein [Corallococcus coralloides]AFE04375.1 hypothetical protein COCOR_01911 [Corallococcus coralloides DSM 2259]